MTLIRIVSAFQVMKTLNIKNETNILKNKINTRLENVFLNILV